VCELSGFGCGDQRTRAAIEPPRDRAADYYYVDGRWSPDGRSVAVTLTDPPAWSSSLHVVDATTGAHRLVAAQGEAVTWAPDGRLVYWRGDRGPLTYIDGRLTYARTDDELRAIDAGGRDSLIARVPRGAVAPDLGHVVYITDYHEGRAEGRDVRVRDLITGADVLLERGDHADEHRYDGVAWSPDGTRLAISSDEGLSIVDPDGSDRVTRPHTERGGLAWLPAPT
jgi:dipeptidyl aminopeptidase/acylaminoacyl peptidase